MDTEDEKVEIGVAWRKACRRNTAKVSIGRDMSCWDEDENGDDDDVDDEEVKEEDEAVFGR